MATDNKPWWRDLSIGVGATVVGGWLLARNWDDLSRWLAEEVKIRRWVLLVLLASPVIAIPASIATTKVLMWWHYKSRRGAR